MVTAFELPTYKEVINEALIIEKGLNDAQAAKEKSLKKRIRSNDSLNQDNIPFKSKARLNQATTEGKARLEDFKCYRCGGPHYQ